MLSTLKRDWKREMKASQKFMVDVEGIKFVARFDELDPKLLPLVARLERIGDEFGPVSEVVILNCTLCVMLSYADHRRGPVKPTILGYDADELMAKQYK
jgi:hypothetical protein